MQRKHCDLKPKKMSPPAAKYGSFFLFLESTTKNCTKVYIVIISNGNRTEWSPIRSVIIEVMTKSDDRTAGVQFVYHEYDY